MPIETHTYPNGLTLVVEPIPGVASAGMTLLLPGGTAVEPPKRQGIGAVLEELIFRGAGDLDARAHADALDLLGVHRDADASTYHFRLGATFLGARTDDVLPLLIDMVRRPHLTDKDFEPAVDLAIQSIESLEDEPQDKAMVELKRLHMGDPLGRASMGRIEDLESMRVKDVRRFAESRFVPCGAVLGLAGAIDFDRVRDRIGELMGDMKGSSDLPNDDMANGDQGQAQHVKAESTQQHLALACETVGERDKLAMTQRLAVAVLSGGMSGRLFTEVREVRGLCYSVHASYVPRRTVGTIYAYAGTTTQRAAETLEVLIGELARLSDGVEADEFERAVVGLKSRLVMQGESTGARARAIARDVFLIGRPRTLEERAAEIDTVSLDALNAFVAEYPMRAFTTVNVGPEPLTAPASAP